MHGERWPVTKTEPGQSVGHCEFLDSIPAQNKIE
jgi:hypothetical protein